MMVRFLLAWLVNTLALIAVAYLMPSITVSSFGAALIAALVLGLVNAIVRPVLVLLTLPVTILTLGLFIFVLNGLLSGWWQAGSKAFTSPGSGRACSAPSSSASYRGCFRRWCSAELPPTTSN